MMQWRDASALAALVLVPALVAAFVIARRRRDADLARFAAAVLWPLVAPDVDPRRRTTRAVLLTAAVTCLVLAIAGPMWGFRWQEIRREGIDLVIAIDTSRSMLATDVKPTRLARAKLAIEDVLAQLHGDRVALVAFAGTAFVQCPLTLDYGVLRQSLDAIDVGIIPRGGTAIATAIDTALGAFEGRQGNHQALILITDGEDTEGTAGEAAKHAAERGVKIFTVGIGTAEGELVPGESGGYHKDRQGQVVKSRLDGKTLEEVAVATGGVYLHATGPQLGLLELYRDHVASMEKRELGTTLERRYEHRFQVPLAMALLLLVLEPLLGDRRRERTARPRWWRRHPAIAAALLAVLGTGWLDPHHLAREGNRLYVESKHDDAAGKYREALLDDPDDARVHFNLGDTLFRQGKYDEAVAQFERVPASPADPLRTARVAYNIGNAKFRMGQALEASEPQQALAKWAEAIAAYRRALGADPDDREAKFNHEFVEKAIADLQKKLEEQAEQQEQQQEQQQDQAGGEQPEQPEGGEEPQQQDQQQPDEQPPPEPQPDQPDDQGKDGAQPQPSQPQPPPPPQPTPDAGGAAAAERKDGEMAPEEAAALLDAQQSDEVAPDEMTRKLVGVGEGNPAKDW